ncbi:type II toxin-antitoxin system VapC family toxin [Dolichospermum sp. LEGE 00240]|jgi:tRNA(fMet)-specific endonuclease VapC|uniref:type II toxin-antitoxin system VapC family toxin n=1 Tax=Dolichospermum sp. LEGE 00240 TaxID=1828603 RepID=UPI001881F88D|nr:type II toxin-antitoxin system VapC family toxin [Dolichospermum sp. LEGE 00240]MDM3847360.1 type II toxin-antitoxin system VapC family toxin [Aphanizomenon gracile PMC638.10]MDM3851436.1 type II toxin-antitoxin system VapC family toxin [Aphanizomenon gracile PMC627.10]MDM3856623.1 type II toxin-antitoxin system VapC family toxin [Aphanizomenon gracile PMC649.10]MDM3859364.1 type II toxin-antitoxin system VapC family toxin [Aphanizomenon gracile PMC644.10]MBE9250267.1 type II toxin-antitoxi
MLFLLDTNILSEPLRSRPNPVVIRMLQQYSSDITTATVVLHELLFGCYRLPIESNKRQIIEVYLQREIKQKIPILPYDIAAAEWFAKERARLTALGKTPAYADGQIAAIAQVNDLTLVTNNVADYSNFQNLKIENWLDL